MTKGEITDAVNTATSGDRKDYLTKGDVEQVVNATLDAIRDGLAAGEEVRLPGFGIFRVSSRAVRDPGTGESLGNRNVVTFKPGAGLKEAVNA